MLMKNLRYQVFLSAAHALRGLPRFRGKVRGGMALYGLLGLDRSSTLPSVEVRLRKPVRYDARLNLQCSHERMALLMNGYEPDCAAFLAQCYPGSGYMLDVGANIGLISLPFAKLIGAGPAQSRCDGERRSLPLVIAVEAFQDNFDTLVHNVRLNGLEGTVQTLHVAVGDADKEVALSMEGNRGAGEGTGTGNILPDLCAYECRRTALHVTTVDRLYASGGVPKGCCLVKLDTDGYDLNVLKGAVDFFAGERPVVFGEFMAACLAWHGQTIADVAAFATMIDYDLFLRAIPQWRFMPWCPQAKFAQDALLVPKEQRGAFGWCIEAATSA